MIRIVLIIPDLFWVLFGLAPTIPGGPVLIRLVLIIPDIFQVMLGNCTYHSWRSGHDKACTYHSLPLPDLFLVLVELAPIIPGGPVLIGLALIIPDIFLVLIGLAPIIPRGPVLIGLALTIPDLFQALPCHDRACTYHSRWSGLDKACTYHS